MLKRTLLIFFLLAFSFQPLYAQTDKAKRDDIKRLMEITGSTGIANQYAAVITEQFFMMMKATDPTIPDRALEVMGKELGDLFTEKMAAPGGLMEQLIPVYEEHFTHAEIKELLAFYASPIGKKTIEVLPVITNESMIIGQAWGESLAPEIETRIVNALKKEGLLPEEKK